MWSAVCVSSWWGGICLFVGRPLTCVRGVSGGEDGRVCMSFVVEGGDGHAGVPSLWWGVGTRDALVGGSFVSQRDG